MIFSGNGHSHTSEALKCMSEALLKIIIQPKITDDQKLCTCT